MFDSYIVIASRFRDLRDDIVGNHCALTGVPDCKYFGFGQWSAFLLFAVQQYCDERGHRHYR